MNLLTFSKANRVYIQYCNFTEDHVQLIQDKAKLFKRGESRIDDFFFQKVKLGIKYPDMSTPLLLIMTLSQKQTEAERGFNNNSLVLKVNLKTDSIVARHFVNSYMIQKEIETSPDANNSTPQLVKYVSVARNRYHLHLEEQKKDKV